MTLPAKQPKPKTCRCCKDRFIPSKPLQVACGIACAVVLAKSKSDKQRKALAQVERAEIKVRKEKLKSKADHAKDAQAAFNEWVRLRDADQSCISCGRQHQGQYHAGHYRTVASSPEIRYEPLNVHKQCAPCNNHKSGDIVNYRINLVKRIGAEKVEWLEGPHEPKRYTIDDLKAITAKYRALVRELKKAAALSGIRKANTGSSRPRATSSAKAR